MNKYHFYLASSLICILLFKTSTIILFLTGKECVQKTQVPLVEDLVLEPSIITHSWFSSSNSKVV